MSKVIFTEESTTPSPPSTGQASIYIKTDSVVYTQNSLGVEVPLGSASSITGLTGDVSATGPGTVTATVNSVGGQSAASIASAVTAASSATPVNTASTIVKRDASGNFAANIITASLSGNATTATTSTSFSGSLSGDVTGTQGATTVATVGGATAANIASTVTTVASATASNTASTLVLRDASGNFAANVITATLSGNATNITATTNSTLTTLSVLSLPGSQVTGNISGNAGGFTGSLSGDVTGGQNTTAIANTVVTGKTLTGYTVGSNAVLAATDTVLGAFEKVQGQINAITTSAGVTSVTATSPLFSSGGTTPNLTIQVANSTQNGYLSSTDWSTFNNKQPAGSYITSITGDATASGPGAAALTLATVNSSPGTYTNATITVNSKGLVTSASSGTGSSGVTAISINSANGFAGTSSGGTTPALTISTTVTGVLKGNGTAISAATAGTDYVIPSGSITGTASDITATSNSTLTTLSSLALPGSQITGTVAIANGGTGQTTANAAFNALSPMTTGGDIIYGGASGVATRLPNGSAGQVLTSSGGTAAPTWTNVSTSGGITRSVNNISTATALAASSAVDYVYLVSGTTTVTLPTAVSNANLYTIKNVGSGIITIATTSSQTIDGSSSAQLKVKYTSLDLISDGTNWNIV